MLPLSMSKMGISHCMSDFLVGMCAHWQKQHSLKEQKNMLHYLPKICLSSPCWIFSLYGILQMVEVAVRTSNSLMSSWKMQIYTLYRRL